MKLLLLAVAIGFLGSCSTTNTPSSGGTEKGQGSFHLDKPIYMKLQKAVFEVVTPKRQDSFIKYERPLPYDKLPYAERNDKYVPIGTAFSIESGKFVSAAHLFSIPFGWEKEVFYIRDRGGKVYKIKEFSKYSQFRDAVEFDVDVMPTDMESLSVQNDPEVGDVVFTVGNALGEGISVRGGEIASFTPEPQEGKWNFIRYSAPASPGNSGGPLINNKGEVVGIVVMKNSNENLNFALPIKEATGLNTSKTEFIISGLPYGSGKNVISKTWQFESKLPISFTELCTLAKRSFKDFSALSYKESFEKNKDEVFPFHPKAKEYLADQSFFPYLAHVTFDSNKNWYINKKGYAPIKADDGSDIYVRDVESKLPGSKVMEVFVEKGKKVPLQKYISDPQILMDKILKTVGWQTRFAEEDIKILSYGPPHKVEWTSDEVGRPWMSAKWEVGSHSRTVELSCLPAPRGMACEFAYYPSYLSLFVSDELEKRASTSFILSYTGSLSDWKDFLALEKRYTPKLFHKSKFVFKPGKKLDFQFGRFSHMKKPDKSINEESVLFVAVGYELEKTAKLDVKGFELFPRQDKTASFEVYEYLKPLPGMSEYSRNFWSDIVGKKAPYDGKAYSKDKSHMVHFVYMPNGRSLASSKPQQARGLNKVFMVSCVAESHTKLSKVAPGCQNFSQAVKYRD